MAIPLAPIVILVDDDNRLFDISGSPPPCPCMRSHPIGGTLFPDGRTLPVSLTKEVATRADIREVSQWLQAKVLLWDLEGLQQVMDSTRVPGNPTSPERLDQVTQIVANLEQELGEDLLPAVDVGLAESEALRNDVRAARANLEARRRGMAPAPKPPPLGRIVVHASDGVTVLHREGPRRPPRQGPRVVDDLRSSGANATVLPPPTLGTSAAAREAAGRFSTLAAQAGSIREHRWKTAALEELLRKQILRRQLRRWWGATFFFPAPSEAPPHFPTLAEEAAQGELSGIPKSSPPPPPTASRGKRVRGGALKDAVLR